MNTLKKLFVAAAVVVSPLVIAAPASAATCKVGFTGPNSDNLCVSETSYECTVNNETNVAVVNDNDQQAGSGTSVNLNNTSGGSSQSGSATNSNGVTFNVTVTNGEACAVVATVPPTPDKPKPAKEVEPKEEEEPAVLAETSGNSALPHVGAIIAGSALAVVGLRGATTLLRRQG